MSIFGRICLLSIGVFFAVSLAEGADQAAPADTASFISSCATNFESCRNAVLDVSNYNQLLIMGGNHGCGFPHTQSTPATRRATLHSDSIAATKAIIEWLNGNAALRAPKTDAAIAQAMATLWPNLCEH